MTNTLVAYFSGIGSTARRLTAKAIGDTWDAGIQFGEIASKSDLQQWANNL